MALIIALTGEKLGGKDTVAEYLVKNYGAFHARHSHVIDDILDVVDLPVSRRNEIDLAMGLRRVFGAGIIGKGLRKRVLEAKDKYPIVVMNGVRFQEEVDDVRSLGGKLIYVTAPEKTRYGRFLKRGEKADDAKQTLEQFREQESEPTEIGIPKLGKEADYTIENTGSLEEFYDKIDKLIGTLK